MTKVGGYEESILNKLRNPDKWTILDNSSILNKLDELAEESFKKGNLEG